MRKKISWLSLVLALVLGLGLMAPAAMAEDVIKLGGIGVLSGPAGLYGLAVQKGVDLYIEQLNAAGGIDGKQVQVIWEDTQGDITVGISAYKKLKEDGVVGLLGPVITSVTKAVADFATDDNMPLITPSATAYEITTDRPNVFRTCFLDPFQAVQMARFAKEKGYEKVAALYDNSKEYSKGLYDSFVAECAAQGIEIVASEAATYEDVDFKTQLTKIKEQNPQAVFLPYYGSAAALILTQANELGFETQWLGADGLADVVDYVGDKSLLTAVTYSDHYSKQSDSGPSKAFVEAFRAKYNEDPEISFSATGYEAALVLCEAIKNAGSTDSAAIVAALKATDVESVSGRIVYDDHNDPIKSAFIMTFDDQGNKQFLTTIAP